MPNRIMIVEDEVFIAELIRRRIEEQGYETEEASDSDEALEVLTEAETPDLILMDIGLGEFSLDGWDLNKKIKENPDWSAIPIIAVTAHAQREEHHDRALREGFVDHVAKPIDFEVLLEKIGSHLKAEE